MIPKRLPVLLIAALALAVVGCEKEGPAERAGAKLDEAVEDGKDKIEDAVENAGDKLEEAGDTIEDKTR